MGMKCGCCNKSIGRYDDYLSCGGECQAKYHTVCVGISEKELVDLKKSGAIKEWKCVSCGSGEASSFSLSGGASNAAGDNACSGLHGSSYADLSVIDIQPCGRCNALLGYFLQCMAKMENRMREELATLKMQLVAEFKAAVGADSTSARGTERQISGVLPESEGVPAHRVRSYAAAATDTRSFVVKPKDASQGVAATKSDLFRKVNPVENGICLARVKGVRDGGVVINCADSGESDKFRKMASDKLAANYEIKEVASLLPRIKIVGLSEKFEADELISCLRLQNNTVILPDSECKFLTLKSLRKREDVFQATMQVDRQTYGRVLASGRLFVGYDNCAVYDAIEVKRCYRCSKFGHFSKECRQRVVCPKCSENHNVKECKSTQEKCVNCVEVNNKLGLGFDVNHAAWDGQCPAYLRILAGVRSDILGTK